MELPKISILIALRNEEKNIPRLLNSIDQLKPDGYEFEVLLGNDLSEDSTSKLIHEYASKRTFAKAFDVPENTGNQKGKARVLAFLAGKAKGEYLFFTDADIKLPENWIPSMMNGFQKKNTGVVIGITGMKAESAKMALQSMEWLTVLYILHLLSKINFPGTGMGNNMAVSKAAYDSIGGYENLPFSIVEDYALFKAIIDKGFGFAQLFDKDSLAYTLPPENFLVQRKRWLKGGFQSGSFLLIPALLQTLWLPLLIAFYFFAKSLLLPAFALQIIVLGILTVFWTSKIKEVRLLKYLPLFVIYLPFSWFLIGIYTPLPGKIRWKGRDY